MAGYATSTYSGVDAATGGVANLRGYLARRQAANILTRGNAGRLPGPSGFSTRGAYANALRGRPFSAPMSTMRGLAKPSTMVAAHPYSSSAASTRALQSGANAAQRLTLPSFVGRGLLAVDPIIHSVHTARNTQGDGYDKFFAGLTSAARRVDNVGVSWGSGVGAAAVTTGLSGGTATVAAPAVGLTTGIAVGAAYEDSKPDRAVNWVVDNTLGRAEPYLASGARTVGNGISRGVSWVGQRARNLFSGSSTTSTTNRRSGIVSGSLSPVGRVSSARLPGQRGTIRPGYETNALDAIAHERSLMR